MAISVFDLFKIGIGPSSSHTVGPMRAARMFAEALHRDNVLGRVHAVRIELFGSLGATGKGHGSDKAIMLGLEGDAPELIDPASIPDRMAAIRSRKALRLLGLHRIDFTEGARYPSTRTACASPPATRRANPFAAGRTTR
jgi:L-serine dehydratase